MAWERQLEAIKNYARDIPAMQAAMQGCVDLVTSDHNKDWTFEEKYGVWEKYSRKEHKPYISVLHDMPVSERIFEPIRCDDYGKYRVVTLETFLDILHDNECSEEDVLAVKREWFENNLGSFTNNW